MHASQRQIKCVKMMGTNWLRNAWKKGTCKWFLMFLFLTTLVFWMLIPGDFVCPTQMGCMCLDLHMGRLGNRLYKFAAAYSLARSKGLKLFISGESYLTTMFHVEGSYVSTWSSCDNLFAIKVSACCIYSSKTETIPVNTSITLKGYFQSFKYFERHKNELKRILTIREDILFDARTKLDNILQDKYMCNTKCKHFRRTLVGIHVRRGDYLSKDGIAFGYYTAPKEYLFKAQQYMRSHFANVTFIVCSDDREWIQNVFQNQNDVIIPPSDSAKLDMALLTLMNHTIMTVGTYGFWSAWLNQNNGTVIYYKDFFKPNSRFSRRIRISDMYYSHWIGL